MSKTNELSQVIEELISCGKGMVSAAEALKAYFSAETVPEKAAEKTPAEKVSEEYSVPVYTFADVRKACSAKSHAGFTDKVKELIAGYGASRLSEIKEEAYASFMSELEALT